MLTVFLTTLLSVSSFDIEVFYASASMSPPVRIDGVRYYDLDAPQRVEDRINAQLVGITEATAEQWIQEFQRSAQGQALLTELGDEYQAIGRAKYLGLTHLPAVVFNGYAVVYGTTDPQRAVQEMKRD